MVAECQKKQGRFEDATVAVFLRNTFLILAPFSLPQLESYIWLLLLCSAFLCSWPFASPSPRDGERNKSMKATRDTL